MNTDIKQIGIFGLSFGKGFDQTWFNLWHKEDGYSADFTQMVSADDPEEMYIETSKMISTQEGEELLIRAFEDGNIEAWREAYRADDEDGIDTELSWTLDVDDLEENDLIFVSGNGKLPPREMIMGVVEAIRLVEPKFAKCFEEFQS